MAFNLTTPIRLGLISIYTYIQWLDIKIEKFTFSKVKFVSTFFLSDLSIYVITLSYMKASSNTLSMCVC